MQEKSLKFILFLIFAKIAYLILESDYNGQILELVTSVKATREDFNALENLGHQLTAVGITLLLLPLFFYLAKRMKSVAASIFVFTSLCTTSIVGTYQGLTYLMDYIIAKQSEKRYESYYISAFKYAMLGGHVGYETFIPQENIQRMDIDDRVMVVNLFLLTHIDPTLLNKIVSKGKNHFLDIFIEQYGMDDMKKAKKDLLDVATKINDGWVKLQEKQKILKNSFSSEVIKRNVIGDYRIFTDELNNKYKEYLKAEKEFVLELNSQLKKIDQYYSNLQRYFRYKNTARAQEQYSKDMYANFGRYIHPSTWCDGTECPSKKAIEAQIRREAKRTWDMKTGGLPMGLGQKPFFRHEVVRKQTIDGLKNKGILVDRSFNYSFEQFQKAYYKKVDKEQKANIQKLIKGFKEESGVNIRINMSYEQYVELFRAKIAERFSKKEIQEEAIRMVKSGDFSDFYNKVFRPSVQDKYFKEYLLTKEDFQKSKNQEKGDNAIKMLYIPPFALFMSLFAAGMNLITVLASIASLVFLKTRLYALAKQALVIPLLLLFLILPYNYGKENSSLKTREIFAEQQFNGFLKYYTQILAWTIAVERINYNYILTLRTKALKLLFKEHENKLD